jgi:tRNA(fMet)-specific endonuclease VapC
MVMFDTDMVIALAKDDARARERYLTYVGKERIVVFSITWYELMVGCANKNNISHLRKITEGLGEVGVMHFDDTVATVAARIASQLSKKGRPIGTADTLIAASCVVNGQTLITRNTKHFEGIPGLKVEAW